MLVLSKLVASRRRARCAPLLGQLLGTVLYAKMFKLKSMRKAGLANIKFLLELYQIQIDSGNLYAHVQEGKSWKWSFAAPPAKAFLAAHCPLECSLQMQGTPCLNVFTNSRKICDSLLESKNPMKVSLKGTFLPSLRDELIESRYFRIGQVGPVCEDELEVDFSKDIERRAAEPFYDDISGAEIDGELVKAAKEDERKGVHKFNVYSKVPRAQCFARTGQPPISTRWVIVNKGDKDNPDVRCRWVARQFKGNDTGRDDLYASTPPLEAKKMLISRAASQVGIPLSCIRKLSFIDIRKAYFHAPEKNEVYVELPD